MTVVLCQLPGVSIESRNWAHVRSRSERLSEYHRDGLCCEQACSPAIVGPCGTLNEEKPNSCGRRRRTLWRSEGFHDSLPRAPPLRPLQKTARTDWSRI